MTQTTVVRGTSMQGAERGATGRRRGPTVALAMLLVPALLVGCSVRRKEVTDANLREVSAAIAQGNDLTPDEAERFRSYALRHLLNPAGAPFPVTVGDAIAAQRRFKADLEARERAEREEAARAERERLVRIEQLRSEVGVQVAAIAYVPSDWRSGQLQDLLAFRVRVANRGAKAIRGVRGSVAFLDTFGREVAVLGMPIEQDVSPGTAVDVELSKPFNQFMDADVAMRNFDFARGRTEWRPEQIVYADGTEAQVPAATRAR